MWNMLSITSYAKCYHYFSLLVWSYTLYILKVLLCSVVARHCPTRHFRNPWQRLLLIRGKTN